MLNEFKSFILRGNVLELAVAVVIGVAFNAVVNSFVNDIIMAFIGAVFGEPNFDQLTLDIGDGVIRYGAFLTAAVNFLLIAVTLFFVMRIAERFFETEEEKKPSEVDLLTEIRDELRASRR